MAASWLRRSARMSRAGFYRSAAVLALLTASGCVTTPVTGRKAFNVASIEDDKQLGADAYQEVLKESKLKDSGPDYDMVKRVVDRIAAVSDDPGFQWEVHVIDDPKTVNAWCMPGGKIAVYTGILPVTKDETGLAVVLGHEIGHAIARHGTERMSQQSILQAGLSAASLKYSSLAEYQELVGTAANLFVFMPFGRDQELEADHIGLIYMARAGYDPEQAVDFWKRMASQSKEAPPEFLSTHPADQTRIDQLNALMPEAEAIYRKKIQAPAGSAKP